LDGESEGTQTEARGRRGPARLGAVSRVAMGGRVPKACARSHRDAPSLHRTASSGSVSFALDGLLERASSISPEPLCAGRRGSRLVLDPCVNRASARGWRVGPRLAIAWLSGGPHDVMMCTASEWTP